MLIAGRVINGFSVGIESAQVPVYIAELSPPSKRARLIGCQQLSITIGILIMYYVSFGASYIGDARDESAFRLPWGLQTLPAVILFCLMFFVPESPRWYARKDRWEECHSVLTLVHGKGDPNHPFVSYELRDIKEMVEFEAHNHANYLQLFQPRYLNRTLIAAFMQIWSQLCGMNVMSMYSVTRHLVVLR
jgi:MFS family permease